MKIRFYHFWLRLGVLLACAIPSKVMCQDLALSYSATGTEHNQKSTTRPLKQVLRELEAKYHIFFTYKDAALQDKLVQVDDRQLQLAKAGVKEVETLVAGLLADQQLHYKKINNIYVVFAKEDRLNIREIKQPYQQAIDDEASNGSAAPAPGLMALSRLERTIIDYLHTKDIAVNGQVTDENDVPLPGVNVLLKGTNTGTTTDANGNFSISVPDNTAVLVFSFIGYIPEEVPVGNNASLRVKLLPDIKTLSEVVVVGYGTQERKDVTGAIGSVDTKQLQSIPIVTADQALQGRVAGVNITANSGVPGAGVKVDIRGIGTVNNSDPLYVIDGFYPANINTINPNDIVSIDILKDASASAIYGVLGANGVVIITTKRAKAGKPTVTYDGQYGFQNAIRFLPLLNSVDYATVSNASNDNRLADDNLGFFLSGRPGDIKPIGSSRVPRLADINNLPAYEDGSMIDTDWQNEIYRTAPISNHNLTVSGGSENAKMLVSLGYLKQNGIVRKSDFERLSLRVNSDVSFGKITFGENLYINRDFRNQGAGVGTGGFGVTSQVTRATPTIRPLDPRNDGGFGGIDRTADGQDAGNPLGVLMLTDNQQRNTQLLGNIFGAYEIIPGLTYKLNLGAELRVGQEYRFTPTYNMGPADTRTFAELYESSYYYFSPLIENTLTFNRTFGKHRLEVLVGHAYRTSEFRDLNGTKRDFPSNNIRVMSQGATVLGLNGGAGINRNEGLLGRVNYEFNDKYLLTANVRRDGSNNFGPSFQYGVFPSLSLGWRISEEEFMKSIPFINDLKLRAGWGIIGNQNIPTFLYSNTLIGTAGYVFGESGVDRGVTQNRASNPLIQWEQTVQTNVGLDFTILDNALTFTADYFIKDTRDLLLANPIPLSTGIDNSPTINIGSIRNTGIELSAGYNKTLGDFSFGINGNISFIRNEVTALNAEGAFIPGGFNNDVATTRTQQGQPIGAFYGFVAEKIFQSESEIYYADAIDGNSATRYQPNPRPGDIKFKDLNGDGVINDQDRTFIGSPFPDFAYGLSANAAYKGFDLSFLFQGTQGNEVYNAIRFWTEGMQRNFNYDENTLQRWRSEANPGNGSVPRGVQGDFNNNTRGSTRFLEDGSYLRLRNITLGYNFGDVIKGRLGNMTNLRAYVTGTNLLTFTRYTGYDPEVGREDPGNSGNNFTRGLDPGLYPLARSVIFGVQFGF
jgi:TonB-dependent starch-binding outer membrane protein SusC